MKKEPIIQFRDFSFKYRSQQEPTLHDINLTILRGEKVLILGPSGSGKSTLGNLINGLIPHAFSGDITGSSTICGRETSKESIASLSKIVGTVLQDPDGQFIGLTVAEDIAFALENDCVEQNEMICRVSKVAELVGIKDFLDHAPHELSGGQKQRVTLAGVLIDNVDILLFDEPLANLDPAIGKGAIEFIDNIKGKTIVIIEHRLEDVLHRNVDRIVVMNDGRVIFDDTVNKLLSSNILMTSGIREPLYVTALKYANVTVTEELNPQHINTLNTSLCRDALKTWAENVVTTPPVIPDENILSLKNISFSYTKETEVIHDISFDVKRGEIISIIGKNGAGKSTVSKIICGFVKINGGQITYCGADITGDTINARANSIGMVMQNPNHMISKPMIFDEVAFGLIARGHKVEDVREKVEKILEICGLYPFRNWPVSALSFGQKKRVTIASILVLDPKVIILDEPTAGQDFKHYTEIMEFLLELNRLHGITIIIITHDMHLMLEYTTRAIVISDGKKIADDTPANVLTDTDIIEKASLKETSLFQLAKYTGLDNPRGFVNTFINYDREVRRHEQKSPIL